MLSYSSNAFRQFQGRWTYLTCSGIAHGLLRITLAGLLCLQAACGGGGSSGSFTPALSMPSPPAEPLPTVTTTPGPAPFVQTATYKVGGSITGLETEGLVLQDNGGDDLMIHGGASTFEFSKRLLDGAPYAATIKSQPAGWTQACDVVGGSGTVAGFHVSSVQVACSKARMQGSLVAGTGTTQTPIGGVEAFNALDGIAVNREGDLYVADRGSHMIRKVSPQGLVTTFAGSTSRGWLDDRGTSAMFDLPSAITLDSAGNLYVVDTGNNRIRKITPQGDVTTLAGSGSVGATDAPGTAATFNGPTGIAIDKFGNLYVADSNNNKIRKVTPEGNVSTLAGSGSPGSANGPAQEASFMRPNDVAMGPEGNIYVADFGNDLIRKISTDGRVTVLAGGAKGGASDGFGSAASFNGPSRMTVDPSGNIYVTDVYNYKIRRITPQGMVTTLEGFETGVAIPKTLDFPYTGIAIDSAETLYVTDRKRHAIWRLKSAPTGTPS